VAILVDFQCPDGHVNERMVDSDCTHIGCLDCNKMAKKILSAVKVGFDPIDGSSWKATRRWTKQREQRIALERKGNS
jgi:hypothetical protein